MERMTLKASRRVLGFTDLRAAVPPLLGQGAQRLLSFAHDTTVVLERQSTRLGDVTEVRGDGAHAATAAGHLDHHLRRTPQNRGLEPGANRSGPLVEGEGGQARRVVASDDPIPGIEQTLAPFDEGGFNG
jgi:hypothetical protein